MKKILKFLTASLLSIFLLVSLVACGKTESLDFTSLTEAETFEKIHEIYNSPSSYLGDTIKLNGHYDLGARTDGSEVELIFVNNGLSHESGKEAEYALPFVMKEGKSHFSVQLEQSIQVKGTLVAEYEDGTSSLDEGAKKEQKKIVFLYLLADYMGIY